MIDPTGAGDTFAGGFVGSLAAAGAGADSPPALFRRAMLDGTVCASFCPEAFGVEGLLAMNPAACEERLGQLRLMMTP